MDASNTPKSSPSIIVLSFNIRFQAMAGKAIGSAPILGGVCKPVDGKKITDCGINMADLIEGIPASLNIPALDFVGLQEARLW